ncbi:MAG: hypothetical protein ACRD3W_22825 [Terriglobales bacterium]
MAESTRTITSRERPWATNRYRVFLGNYVLDSKSGLYFHVSVSAAQRRLISRTVMQVPAPLRQLACSMGLTVSTNYGLTTAGHQGSTLYADFKQRDRQLISPHIEIGSYSFSSPELLLAHLIHEHAHIWWGCLQDDEREQFRRYLRASCKGSGVTEVTRYVQSFFAEWLRVLKIKESYGENHRRCTMDDWSRESFADSCAAICVPGYGDAASTVDLTERCERIEWCTGLPLAPIKAFAAAG